MAIIAVTSPGRLTWRDHRYRCAIGVTGVTGRKREADGATPLGCFAMRRILYRADRLAAPPSDLPAAPLSPDDGWCDDPADPAYNRLVKLPHAASAETLWRSDGLYDVIVVLGYNDDPVVAGCGSAIFLHVAAADFAPTRGCVALARHHLLAVLQGIEPGQRLCVVG